MSGRARPRNAAAAKARTMAVQNRYRKWGTPAPDLPTLGGLGCWCGKPNGHHWPGEEDGAPHPR